MERVWSVEFSAFINCKVIQILTIKKKSEESISKMQPLYEHGIGNALRFLWPKNQMNPKHTFIYTHTRTQNTIFTPFQLFRYLQFIPTNECGAVGNFKGQILASIKLIVMIFLDSQRGKRTTMNFLMRHNWRISHSFFCVLFFFLFLKEWVCQEEAKISKKKKRRKKPNQNQAPLPMTNGWKDERF